MKLIALPDLHGRAYLIDHVAEVIQRVDWVLLPGDVTNGRVSEAQALIHAIRQHNPHILAVPGNMDTDLIARTFAEQDMNIHRQNKIIEGIAFVGLGGALPFYGDFVFSETELATMLDEASANLAPFVPQILLSHQPPYDTACDRLKDGAQVGSVAVRAYIEKRQPLICFTGHIHESKGVDQIGRTYIINPGPLSRGSYGYAEIVNSAVVMAEIRDL